MSELHPAEAFVHDFHRDLTLWFSGAGEAAQVWARLQATTPADMTLVYPSGRRLAGAAFLDTIRDRHGGSPGFEARVEAVRIVAHGPEHAVVAYTEIQRGAKQSTSVNQRTALAVVERHDGAWRWRYIQETDCGDS